MPLLDHFRKPASRVPWRSLENGWRSQLVGRLNSHLPHGYIALDVSGNGATEEDSTIEEAGGSIPLIVETRGRTTVATARAVYQPPPATGTALYEFPDTTEIRVTNEETGQLVGAIELVSPGNKDRGAKRDMFIAKCLDNIAGGACVVIVDVITARRANLHNELATMLGADNLAMPEEACLYAVTYRPIIRKRKMNVDVWVNPLQIGRCFPPCQCESSRVSSFRSNWRKPTPRRAAVGN